MTGMTKYYRVVFVVVIFFGTIVTVLFVNKTSTLSNGMIWSNNTIIRGIGLQLKNKGVENTDMAAKKDNGDRLRRLQRECQHHQQDLATHHDLHHIIVDNTYKVLFCYIPKISCSQWKIIFIRLSGKVTNTSLLKTGTIHSNYQRNLSFLTDYNKEDRTKIINEYKKYMIVRNPLERLLSAYRSKLTRNVSDQPVFQNYGKKIVKMYRPNANQTSRKLGNDVTFLEFVKYIIGHKTRCYNSHWERYTALCRPCSIKYDFIGKYETIHRDADFILKDIGAPSDVRFPINRSEEYKEEETRKVFDKYYSQIPLEYIAKLRQIYQVDLDLFGYALPENLSGTEPKS